MTLEVAIDRPFRSPLRLRELVAAVYNAGEYDESDWIEWKSTLDLSVKEVRATLARHIVGMANRSVEKSSRFAAGHGYIVVGLEPGRVDGVSALDLADLESGVRPYLGHDGPEWSASYVNFQGRSILVIAVDPPKVGDPIHTLHRDFGKYSAGMIFVRRAAQTVQAGPGEVQKLAARTVKADERHDVTLEIDPNPVCVPVWPWLDESVGVLTEKEQGRVLVESYTGDVRKRDPRSHADYESEVTAYVNAYQEYARTRFITDYVDGHHGCLKMRLVNRKDRSYQNVRLELEIPEGMTAVEAEDFPLGGAVKPQRPIPLGGQSFMFTGGGSMMNFRSAVPEGLTIEGGMLIFDVPVLRSEEILTIPDIHILNSTVAEGSSIEAPWAVTVVNARGRSKGALEIVVRGSLERRSLWQTWR